MKPPLWLWNDWECVAACALRSHTYYDYVNWLKSVVVILQATHSNTQQHTATHCNTLQHTATHCNTLQHTAAHCSTLQHTATHCNILQTPETHTATHRMSTSSSGGRVCVSSCYSTTRWKTLQHTAAHCSTHCSTLQHTATHTAAHCSTLQHTATHWMSTSSSGRCVCAWSDILQHAATRCNTLQHAATHCSTLQHTAAHCASLQHTLHHTLQHTGCLPAAAAGVCVYAAVFCNTLQHTAAHCNTLQHTAAHCNTLQNPSNTHCNTQNVYQQPRRVCACMQSFECARKTQRQPRESSTANFFSPSTSQLTGKLIDIITMELTLQNLEIWKTSTRT